MRKTGLLCCSILLAAVLSACSVQSDAANLYKQETPLQVELNLPESISPNTDVVLEAALKQEGKKVEQAAFVHFEIWKKDGSVHYPMEEATAAGNGVYQMGFNFKNEGLYYIEVHAGNNGSIVNPQYQFIVGNLSDDELKSLKQRPAKKEGTSDHHH